MEVIGQLHASTALPPGKKKPGTHWIGGWMGPRTVLDAVVKIKIRQFLNIHKYEKFGDLQVACKRVINTTWTEKRN
jgi:hypothetical protein